MEWEEEELADESDSDGGMECDSSRLAVTVALHSQEQLGVEKCGEHVVEEEVVRCSENVVEGEVE